MLCCFDILAYYNIDIVTNTGNSLENIRDHM